MRSLLLVLPLPLFFAACQTTEEPVDPSDTAGSQGDIPDYSSAVPDYLSAYAAARDNTPAGNPNTDAGVHLGRHLFFDKALSRNRTVSCASCHLPERSYTDGLPFSEGFEGGLTGRTSMPLVNLRYYGSGRMFWDERANTLENQVLMPIQDEVEMGMTLDEVLARLEEDERYAPMFEAAFGDEEITVDGVSRALAQFVRALTSFDSRWDAALAAGEDPLEPFSSFTAAENRGKTIFFGRHEQGIGPLCSGCHLPPPPPPGVGLGGGPDPGLFFMPGPRVNGLPDDSDFGVGDVSGQPADRGAFKSPSLRNLTLRGPYMHDGRFQTLAEVVDFYSDEIADVPNLDPLLRDGPNPRRLNLSAEDRAALVAFLETLSDPSFGTDPRFHDPFLE
jgi:cytochrome c peroxidase